MQRVATYCRVALDENGALARQQDRIRTYCEAQAYHVVLAESDIGSGRTLHHLGLTRLRKAISSHAIDVLVVERLNRLARDVSRLWKMLSFCARHNVRIDAIDEAPGERERIQETLLRHNQERQETLEDADSDDGDDGDDGDDELREHGQNPFALLKAIEEEERRDQGESRPQVVDISAWRNKTQE